MTAVKTRLERKGRKDILIAQSGGVLDLFDNVIKEAWRINDEEYNHICDKASDSLIDMLVNENMTFTQAREAVNEVNQMVHDYNQSNI